MQIGRRIPREFFVTGGVGESDITVHAGSYHLALRQAGIEMCNIMRYSSIIPKGARQVIQPPRKDFVHGEVLECIEASASVSKGSRATAGLIFAYLFDEEDEEQGGLVCEYSGSLDQKDARHQMILMLGELYENGYSHLRLGAPQVYSQTVTPQKGYGTALVAIGFLSHEIPVIDHG